MKVRVQLVENNPLHRVPTVLVNINRTQFMFNVIPSLLRHRKRHKISLYHSSSIFFTKNSVEAMGGLPNLLLFRAGTEHSNSAINNKIFVFGDNSLVRYLQKLKFKLGYKFLRLSYTDWQKQIYRFGILSSTVFKKIRQHPNLPKIFANINTYLKENANFKDYYDCRFYIVSTVTKYINITCNHYHCNLLDIYPLVYSKGRATLTSYILILPELKKGVDVNIQKFSAETNIKSRQDIKQLKTKGSITKDGKKYFTKNYLFEEDVKPTNLMILHHQSIDSISELLKNEILKNYFQNQNKTGVVVHIVQNHELFQSVPLRKLLQCFQPTTKHLWFNHKISQANSIQQTLEENILVSSLWSQVFPNQIKNIKSQRFKYYSLGLSTPIKTLFPTFSHLLYQRAYNFTKNVYLGDTYDQRLEASPKQSRLNITKQIIQTRMSQLSQLRLHNQNLSDAFEPKVILLGTASSMPTVDRNTSGILISLFKDSSILFDCGEETFQQIVNHYSPQQLEEQLLKIKIIFITHIHSDHNLGILNLISQRRKLMKKHKSNEKIFLMIPFNVFNWYHSYNLTVQDLSDSCEVIFTQLYLQQSIQQDLQKKDFSCASNNLDYKIEAQLQISIKNKEYVQSYLSQNGNNVIKFKTFLKENGYLQFLPMRVIHCPQSFGITVSSAQFKVSYSGDTRPSLDFQQIAKNSNIMIHEATFNDEQAKEAQKYLHSTVQEAVNIGLQSKSKVLVLTHFSQDFATPKQIQNEAKMQYYKKNTILAFDHLQVKLNKPHNLCQISKKILQISYEVQRKLLSQNKKQQKK